MKIENERLSGAACPAAQSAEVERSQPLNRYRQNESTAAGASDRVEISGLTGSILKAGEPRSSEQAARVRGLAAAYKAGRYAVDPRQVSHKLVDSWLAGGLPHEKK